MWRKGKQLWGKLALFQWAPTLGGECYGNACAALSSLHLKSFQWAPTLGGECYFTRHGVWVKMSQNVSMGTHPWG